MRNQLEPHNPASAAETTTAGRRSSRLEQIVMRPRFYPWVRAEKMEGCQLYWLPVSEYPAGYLQREWLLRFLQRLLHQLEQKRQLEAQNFLGMGVVMPALRETFIQTAPAFKPLFGLGRHPGRPLPPLPDERYAKLLQEGKITYDAQSLRPDYVYWLSGGDRKEQRRLFTGFGGMVTLLLPPTETPPLLRPFRVRAIHDPAMRRLAETIDFNQKMKDLHAIDSAFLKQSKEVFAADLKHDPQYPGLLFALPLLAAEDFFAATPDAIGQWFQLFNLYVRESPEDKGVLLASVDDVEQDMEAVLKTLQSEGLPGWPEYQ